MLCRNTINTIRVWKDEEYRLSLSEAERALLQDNPAALMDLMEQLAIRSGALTIPVVAEGHARGHGWAAVAHQVCYSWAGSAP
jgi:mersacidin/lichenicidin family type 2 lantibiotic